jgi:hypothetical protein
MSKDTVQNDPDHWPAVGATVQRGVRPHCADARKPRTFVLNFKKEFAQLVEQGYKKHTIRGPRNDGKIPVPGDQLRLYTGLRTRGTRWLRDGEVLRCRGVRIDLPGNGAIVVAGELLTQDQRTEFAKDDGFNDWASMRKWFADQYGDNNLSTWEGFCIEWA